LLAAWEGGKKLRREGRSNFKTNKGRIKSDPNEAEDSRCFHAGKMKKPILVLTAAYIQRPQEGVGRVPGGRGGDSKTRKGESLKYGARSKNRFDSRTGTGEKPIKAKRQSSNLQDSSCLRAALGGEAGSSGRQALNFGKRCLGVGKIERTQDNGGQEKKKIKIRLLTRSIGRKKNIQAPKSIVK